MWKFKHLLNYRRLLCLFWTGSSLMWCSGCERIELITGRKLQTTTDDGNSVFSTETSPFWLAGNFLLTTDSPLKWKFWLRWRCLSIHLWLSSYWTIQQSIHSFMTQLTIHTAIKHSRSTQTTCTCWSINWFLTLSQSYIVNDSHQRQWHSSIHQVIELDIHWRLDEPIHLSTQNDVHVNGWHPADIHRLCVYVDSMSSLYTWCVTIYTKDQELLASTSWYVVLYHIGTTIMPMHEVVNCLFVFTRSIWQNALTVPYLMYNN